ncbi:MAG: hypothetical protein AB1758_07885 [Candidatus Eremiobacterota bacterium]
MRWLCATFLWLALLHAARADTPVHLEAAGLAVSVPDGWSAASEGTHLVVGSGDGAVVLVFMVVEPRDLARVISDLHRNQVRHLGRTRQQAPRSYDLNGLAVQEEQGVSAQGDLWQLLVVSASRPVVVYTLTSAQGMARYEAQYLQLLRSLRPL